MSAVGVGELPSSAMVATGSSTSIMASWVAGPSMLYGAVESRDWMEAL
jgi:hypothetical protein